MNEMTETRIMVSITVEKLTTLVISNPPTTTGPMFRVSGYSINAISMNWSAPIISACVTAEAKSWSRPLASRTNVTATPTATAST
jgi:hypothetical protein